MTEVWQLFRLQQVDNQIKDLCRQRDSLDDGTSFVGEIEKIQNEKEKNRERLKNNHLQLKKLELEVNGITSNIKEFENKLYGGKTLNPKELAGWQGEIEQLKSKRDKLEEKMLIIMEENDAIEHDLINLEKELEEKKVSMKESQQKFSLEMEEIERNLESLREKRDAIVQNIMEEDILNRYESLRQQKNGVAVVKIQKGNCGGCFMNLPESVLKKVQARQIEYCTTCGRILFSDGE